MELEFVYPPGRRPTETAFFTKVVETMDLWHHCMGHIGEAATKSLLQSVKGVTFPPGDNFPNVNLALLANMLIRPISCPPLQRPLNCWSSSFVIFAGPSWSQLHMESYTSLVFLRTWRISSNCIA